MNNARYILKHIIMGFHIWRSSLVTGFYMLKLWPHARLQQLSWNCIHWCLLWSWRYLEAQGIRFDLSLPTLTFIITLWKKTSKIEAPMFDGKAILLWHCVQSHFWASGVIVFCVTSLEMMLSEGISPAFFEMGLSWHDPCWQHFLYSIHQAATVPNIPPPLPPPKHSLFQTAFCLSTLAVRYGIFKNGYLKLLDILVITIKCILSTRN